MAVAILPMVFPAQMVFSALLVLSIIVWGATMGARQVFAYARTVTRATAVRAVVVAVILAVMLAYATPSYANFVVYCGPWCWY